MILTLQDVLTIFTIVFMASGGITTIFLYFDKKKNTALAEKVAKKNAELAEANAKLGIKNTEGDYTNDMTAALSTVYKQAKEALQDKAAAEKLHKEEMAQLREELRIEFEVLRTENMELKRIVALLQAQIANIVFEIKLIGQMTSNADPLVKTVTITRVSPDEDAK